MGFLIGMFSAKLMYL